MPTSIHQFTRQWVAIEETTKGVTPTTGSWFNTGFTKLTPGIALSHQLIRMPGSRKVYADIVGMETDTFNVTYFPFDTKMIQRGILYGGTGTNEKSLSILQSQKVSGVQKYKLYQGCMTVAHTLNITDIYSCTQSFRALNITGWKTQAEIDALIGATPTYPSALTARPFSNTDSLTGPFTLDGEIVKTKEATLNTAWEILEQRPQGDRQPVEIDLGNVEYTFDLTTWADNAPDHLGDLRGFAPIDGTYRLWDGSPDCILTLDNLLWNNYETDYDTEAGSYVEESLSGVPADVSITNI
jgi:hypothetical protein